MYLSVDMCACLGLCGCVTAGECIYMWVCECGCECVLGVGVQVPGRGKGTNVLQWGNAICLLK